MMKITTWIKLVMAVFALALAVGLYFAWRGERRGQIALQAGLKAAQTALEEAAARQKARENDLSKVLAQISEQKATVVKPKQVLEALPSVLPLPKALEITQQTAVGGPTGGQKGAEVPDSPRVNLPAEDLRPLYDFALDCKACQARLTVAQNDLKDEQSKTATLGRERDNALQAARGGSALRRVLRAAKWFALGAAAGALAAKIAR